ncbi:MAG TPA: glycosyl hydrolase [Firmicutes bacterium]|nr:glycosyl hydrolase [Bacillota bacterium]
METKEKVKVGLIGLGQRGNGLLPNILNNDALITCICDKFEDRIAKIKKIIKDKGFEEPFGTTSYLDVLDKKPDCLIVATSWNSHVEVALAAMDRGIPVAIEVGGTHNIADCWKLIDTYEKTKTPFFFLENCCYGKDEMLATSLARNGLLGEIVYCQGAYSHDLREEIAGGIDTHHYRLEEYKNHNCENYPTHELGPIAKVLNINRGNRFLKVVSMSSKACGMEEFIKKTPKYKDRLANVKFKQGDVTTTMIECENGETILLKLDTTLPHLYDRNFTVCGTEGVYCQTTKSVVLDDGRYDHEKDPIEKSFLNQKDYDEYLPEDWKGITQEQIDAGHGGMDFVMLKHFFKYIKNKEEMPIDIYDAAAWMSVTSLSEESIAKGSIPIECPDFTRGKYKNRKPLDVLSLPTIVKK